MTNQERADEVLEFKYHADSNRCASIVYSKFNVYTALEAVETTANSRIYTIFDPDFDTLLYAANSGKLILKTTLERFTIPQQNQLKLLVT